MGKNGNGEISKEDIFSYKEDLGQEGGERLTDDEYVPLALATKLGRSFVYLPGSTIGGPRLVMSADQLANFEQGLNGAASRAFEGSKGLAESLREKFKLSEGKQAS